MVDNRITDRIRIVRGLGNGNFQFVSRKSIARPESLVVGDFDANVRCVSLSLVETRHISFTF